MSSLNTHEERHYLCYDIFQLQAEAGRPSTRIDPSEPGMHPIELMFVNIDKNHWIEDPSYFNWDELTLISEVKVDAHRNWTRCFPQMLDVLSAMHVPKPEQPVLIRKLFRFLETAVPGIPISVIIMDVVVRLVPAGLVVNTLEEQALLDRIIDTITWESMEPKLTPATKSSMEGLEKVELDVLREDTSFTCAICKEGHDDFDAVEEEEDPGNCSNNHDEPRLMSRLPCLHVYHEKCIVQWLEISHLCPLCRYPMPTMEVGAVG